MKMRIIVCLSAFLMLSSPNTFAVNPADSLSPANVVRGKALFEQEWKAVNPLLGRDGLGPQFNASSCVACHHQGGMGGGGDSRFNAKSIGIDKLTIRGGPVNSEVLRRLISTFHPGFVGTDGTVINTLAVSHHGGSDQFDRLRKEIEANANARFADTGGPLSGDEVRLSGSAPIRFRNQVGDYTIELRAWMFQRNTTAVFGAGLIDQVTIKTLESIQEAQQRHPEVSGRIATLSTGRVGKFGWRGNVASLVEFTDQACANELGLETERRSQPPDPTQPAYQNVGCDIPDDQIVQMRDFMAALPRPLQILPSDTRQWLAAERGEKQFAAVGCAVCHQPEVQGISGIYSDLLLHDMGYQSMDLNHAEPYIRRATPMQRVDTRTVGTTVSGSGSRMVGGYYGPATEISVNLANERISERRASQGMRRPRIPRGPATGFSFIAPQQPSSPMALVNLATNTQLSQTESSADTFNGFTGDFTFNRTDAETTTQYVRLHFEPTNFNQEWRTPPLWGVADSAPYMHDGRAETLLESIAMHAGEAAGTRDRFLALPVEDQQAVITFLETLKAPADAPPAAL